MQKVSRLAPFAKSSNVSAAKKAMTKAVAHGQTAAQSFNYSIGGANGVAKYIGDYSTLGVSALPVNYTNLNTYTGIAGQ